MIDLHFKLNDAIVMFVYTKPAVILPAEVQTVFFDHDFELHFCSELVSPLSDVGESQFFNLHLCIAAKFNHRQAIEQRAIVLWC